MGILKKLFATYSEREVKRINKVVNKILKLENTIKSLSDEELREKTNEFRNRLKNNETLDDILIEAFAVCREASKRVLGMQHYEVQLIGGVVLHQGRIAEMRTGEGKTLVATLPVYLNALTGDGVHVVTVNDYLAERDLMIMKPLYDFLGVTSGVILGSSSREDRQTAYNCDITYITNSELGFDYLRDNMVALKSQQVHRKLNYAVIDEVDSILIDEARTPLIVSGQGDELTHQYRMADIFVKTLKEEDYRIDEKVNSIILTDSGVNKAEKTFVVENYGDIENSKLMHLIDKALRANYMLKKDKDYLVKNGKVLIIDTFTGRIAEGRQFADGQHQALQAKEGVKIEPENKTLATITYQNFFKLYKKTSGMTGTGITEEQEFRDIYNLDVIAIPPNKPVQRIDENDKVYFTENAKFKAIVNDVKECNKKGQPVLIGTSTIEKSELLSNEFKKENIPHKVLNAKFYEMEAEIISHAGEKGAVTIATNMAGRGTDIKLGEGVEALGGLRIIGTERHESRRIDNQLRGRSGRQGDKGSSIFYLSLEDELLNIFMSDSAKENLKKLAHGEDCIQEKMITKAIESAQKRIEGKNFESRKNTIQYDNVVNEQRKIIYEQRNAVLNDMDLHDEIISMIKEVFDRVVDYEFDSDEIIENNELYNKAMDKLHIYLKDKFPLLIINKDELINADNINDVKEMIINLAIELYESKIEELGEEDLKCAERQAMLALVDKNWVIHLTVMSDLRDAVRYQSYNQKEPVQEYILRGADLFDKMRKNIQDDVVASILKLQSIHRQNIIRDVAV